MSDELMSVEEAFEIIRGYFDTVAMDHCIHDHEHDRVGAEFEAVKAALTAHMPEFQQK